MFGSKKSQRDHTSKSRPDADTGLFGIGCLAAILFLLVFFTSSSASPGDEFSFYAIDVGQGDAMIVHQPERCTMLIDAGLPLYAGRLIRMLETLQTHRLDMAIITHPDIDHFGALVEISEEFPVDHLFDNGAEGDPSPEYNRYRELRESLPYQRLASGNELRCGDITIEVMHPFSTPGKAATPNDTSLVLILTNGDFRLLHMGDLAGRPADKFVAVQKDSQSTLNADVIKIAHHGYDDAASAALLDLVAPEYAIISTSGNSCIGTFCSPAQSVLKRLEERSISYFRTDRDGNVKIFVKDTGFLLSTSSMQK